MNFPSFHSSSFLSNSQCGDGVKLDASPLEQDLNQHQPETFCHNGGALQDNTYSTKQELSWKKQVDKKAKGTGQWPGTDCWNAIVNLVPILGLFVKGLLICGAAAFLSQHAHRYCSIPLTACT